MLALLAELSDEFAAMRMFRPNRDVRFAKDKSPYKLWAGATSESHAVGGTGYYVSVSASGMVTGCGAMALARDQLQRFRAALDDDHSPASIAVTQRIEARRGPRSTVARLKQVGGRAASGQKSRSAGLPPRSSLRREVDAPPRVTESRPGGSRA